MNTGPEAMNMFNKKPEPRHAGETPAQAAVLQMPERAQREPSRPATLVPASAPARESSAARAVKSSLISEGFEYTGDIRSDGALTVEGVIRGNLVLKALTIGPTGLVDGSVKAESIIVEGSLYGSAECADLVIGGNATFDGKLAYATLTIQRGGTVKGELTRSANGNR